MILRVDRAAIPVGESPGRWAGGDALKGFALLLVIIYHAGGVLGYPNVLHGELGVDIFLLLSGLMLTLNSTGLTWREFVARRFFRIYPAYWAAVALFVWGGTVLLRKSYSLSDVLAHLAGVQATVNGAYASDINDSFWYITAILGLYLVFLLVRRRRADALFLCGCAGLITAIALVPAPGFAHLAPRLPSFFVGLIIGQVLREGRLILQPGFVFAAGALCAASLGWALGLNYLYVISAVALAAAFLYFDGKLRQSRPGRSVLAPFQWIGIYSYEIYLFHQPLIRDYNVWFFRELGGYEPSHAELGRGIAVGLVVTLLIAIGVHHGFTAVSARQRPAIHRRRLAIGFFVLMPILALIGTRWAEAGSEPAYRFIGRMQRQLVGHLPGRDSCGGWCGPLEIQIRLPAQFGPTVYPLIVTGRTGVGDLLGMRRIDRDNVQFLLDHWGSQLWVSDPIKLSPRDTHQIFLSLGSLLPPLQSGYFLQHPDLVPMATRLFVTIDGQPVFNREVRFHSAEKSAATAGFNGLGGSTTATYFPEGIDAVRPIDPAVVITRL